MSHTKRAWIISGINQFVVERNGALFQYQLRPTERNGYTSIKEAKAQLYAARRALHDDRLTIITV